MKCDLCGGTFKSFYKDIGEYTAVKCKCGLVYINYPHTTETISEFYDQEYYDDYSCADEENIPLNMALMRRVLKYKKKGILLDVGCGSGNLLKMARDNGFNTYGIDISETASRKAVEAGFQIYTGQIEDNNLEPNSFDIVVSKNVIEHTLSPTEFLKSISRVLKPNGLLVLLTPNYLRYITKGKDDHNFIREHLYYFTPYTIQKYLKKTGFKIIFWRTGFISGLIVRTLGKLKGSVSKNKDEHKRERIIVPNTESTLMKVYDWINEYDKIPLGYGIEVVGVKGGK